MAWHIKKTSIMGAGVGDVYYVGDKGGLKLMLTERLIRHKQRQRQKIIFGKRRPLLVGM